MAWLPWSIRKSNAKRRKTPAPPTQPATRPAPPGGGSNPTFTPGRAGAGEPPILGGQAPPTLGGALLRLPIPRSGPHMRGDVYHDPGRGVVYEGEITPGVPVAPSKRGHTRSPYAQSGPLYDENDPTRVRAETSQAYSWAVRNLGKEAADEIAADPAHLISMYRSNALGGSSTTDTMNEHADRSGWTGAREGRGGPLSHYTGITGRVGEDPIEEEMGKRSQSIEDQADRDVESALAVATSDQERDRIRRSRGTLIQRAREKLREELKAKAAGATMNPKRLEATLATLNRLEPEARARAWKALKERYPALAESDHPMAVRFEAEGEVAEVLGGSEGLPPAAQRAQGRKVREKGDPKAMRDHVLRASGDHWNFAETERLDAVKDALSSGALAPDEAMTRLEAIQEDVWERQEKERTQREQRWRGQQDEQQKGDQAATTADEDRKRKGTVAPLERKAKDLDASLKTVKTRADKAADLAAERAVKRPGSPEAERAAAAAAALAAEVKRIQGERDSAWEAVEGAQYGESDAAAEQPAQQPAYTQSPAYQNAGPEQEKILVRIRNGEQVSREELAILGREWGAEIARKFPDAVKQAAAGVTPEEATALATYEREGMNAPTEILEIVIRLIEEGKVEAGTK